MVVLRSDPGVPGSVSETWDSCFWGCVFDPHAGHNIYLKTFFFNIKKKAPIVTVETGLEASWLLLWSSKETGDLNKDSGQRGHEERERRFNMRQFSRH